MTVSYVTNNFKIFVVFKIFCYLCNRIRGKTLQI